MYSSKCDTTVLFDRTASRFHVELFERGEGERVKDDR